MSARPRERHNLQSSVITATSHQSSVIETTARLRGETTTQRRPQKKKEEEDFSMPIDIFMIKKRMSCINVRQVSTYEGRADQSLFLIVQDEEQPPFSIDILRAGKSEFLHHTRWCHAHQDDITASTIKSVFSCCSSSMTEILYILLPPHKPQSTTT